MSSETSCTKMKHAIIVAASILMIVLIACTFISRTVYTSMLPRVETDLVRVGQLHYRETADATILYPDIICVTAMSNIKIMEILCQPDTAVNEGDPIIKVNQSETFLQRRQIEYQIWSIEQQENSRNMDIAESESLSRQKEILELQLEILLPPDIADGFYRAPSTGMILDINASAGQYIPGGAVLFRIIPDNSKPDVIWYLDKQTAKDFRTGVQCEFTYNAADVSGVIQESLVAARADKVWDREEMKYCYSFALDTDDRTLHGLIGEVLMSSQSQIYKKTVPLSAIHDLGGMPYMFVVRTREGLFGKELYVTRIDAKVVESNQATAALDDFTFETEDRVVTSSNVPLQSGDAVWSITQGVSELKE